MATRANNKHKTNDTPQSSPPLNHGQLPSTPSGLPWDPHKPLNHPGSSGLPERQVTLSKNTPPEGVKTPSVQLGKVPLYIQENIKDLPVGGRLKWFVEHWEQQGAHPFQLDLLRQGYRLPFRDHPKLSRTPCIHSEYNDADKDNALSTSILDLLTKNAIEKVNKQDSLGFYSRLFLVPKPGNKWRPVIDLSSLNSLQVQDGNSRIYPHIAQTRRMGHLNRSVRCISTHPHSPSIKKVPQVSPQGNHIPVHQPSFRTGHGPPSFYLPSEGGKAPGLKTRHPSTPILRRLVNKSHFSARGSGKHNKTSLPGSKPGFHRKPQEIGAHPPAEVRLHRLPFCVGPRPGQTHKRQMEQDPKYIQRNRDEIDSQCTDTYVHHWITCIHGENCETGQDTHETFSMASQDSLESSDALEFSNSLDSQNETTQGMVAKSPKRPSRRIPTPRDHDILIFTDASNAGWGAHLNHDSVGGLWSQIEKRLHINVLELKAVILALQHFSHQCHKKQVLVASDNTTVVAHINKQGGTHSTELCALMWRLLTWCNKHQITLRARHVPGSLNVIADGLSRRNQIQHTEWSLAPHIFTRISLLWERPQIDLFATNLNNKLPTYVSPIPDPQAWAVDALNISWKNMIGYAFPPTALLPRVVQKLLSQQCRLILIAPGWPTKPWFWDLVELSLDIPRQLPPIRSLLKQPLNNQFHTHPESLNLHAWYLGAQPSRTKALPQRWQIELLHLSTRAIYASKWSVFERWCIEQQVDFRSPSIKHICEFMCFLFNEEVFLLALASGKRRSEIHAWTLDGLLCLGEWDQIQLTPSPSFIAKNQLAKEGNQAVSPVVIPALATPQNDSNEDALLCPVRALSTYLKLTADLRQDKALLFVSYKQGHSKDIQCSTISSWIKNTIKYCYSRVENSDMDLLGVKAHDVRAFAASKAFYGGVFMDQILQACHWKSHNTFTSFYLKDLSGQNQKDLSFHLGSFVAAQQVVTPP